MNRGELNAYIRADILNRDDADLPSKIDTAIEFAHDEMQDLLDWRAMEVTEQVTYTKTSTGVALPSGWKRVEDVWRVKDGNLIPLVPSTTRELVGMRGTAQREPRALSWGSANYHDRWHEHELQIKMFFAPDEDITLELWGYKKLPAYTQDSDSDWFSENLWRVMAFGAAALGSVTLWEDPRSGDFQKAWEIKLRLANDADMKAKQGGAYRIRRPPLAGPRM